jgi:hypothetical protein
MVEDCSPTQSPIFPGFCYRAQAGRSSFSKRLTGVAFLLAGVGAERGRAGAAPPYTATLRLLTAAELEVCPRWRAATGSNCPPAQHCPLTNRQKERCPDATKVRYQKDTRASKDRAQMSRSEYPYQCNAGPTQNQPQSCRSFNGDN